MKELSKKDYNRLYYTWRNIRYRCYYEKHPTYEYYGKLGIEVQESWRNDSKRFMNYVSNLDNFDLFVNSNYSLDRIDSTKGYEEGNLKWSSKQEQVLNRKACKSTTGYRGIKPNKSGKRFISRIFIDGQEIGLGTFDSIIEVITARNKYIDENNLPNLKDEIPKI